MSMKRLINLKLNKHDRGIQDKDKDNKTLEYFSPAT